ncbi:peptidylprolyl isomerase [Undibacterium sp. FT79W]|jgi:peptidyl-prolyl cis-trans isomerase C|uniref:peptidylprolyl isomerase n=1 Tax=unclassified Undibacterium TaxID=2630295 RepID=UPI00164B775E|nr:MULTISPECIES: peptidylprolyl isomerase [unclassified Undibacterium]MBC3877491.1 peptidylprolyl isomerase [Undibacterium sp. FT79W]MBK1888578.1 peptidylprolyl isomerase [Undibacterium sp. 14-3-2]
MSIKSRVVLGSAIALFALSACNDKDKAASASAPASAAAESKEAVAATVNGTPISKKQLDQIMQQQAAQGMPDNQETRKMVIDQLAMQILVAQEATNKGLDKVPEVKEQLDMARLSILANSYVKDYMKTATVSDEALKAEYDKFKTTAGGTEFKARHILVASEEEAKDIIAKIKKDVKAFDGLAKAKSQDPGSKGKGGDLGWFNPRSMVPEFGEAVAKLEKGKFTETPVKSQFGYHVIILDDSRPLAVPALDDVKAPLTQQLQQQNLKKTFDDLKAKAKIEITAVVPAAPASAAAASPAATPAPVAAPAEAAKK